MGVYLGSTNIIGGGGGGGGGGFLGWDRVTETNGCVDWPDGAYLAIVNNYGTSYQSGLSVPILRSDYSCRIGCISAGGCVWGQNHGSYICVGGCQTKEILFYGAPNLETKGYVDVLVVGGGEGGGYDGAGCSSGNCWNQYNYGASAGGVILCQHYPLMEKIYSVKAGCGGCSCGCGGYSSFFGELYAYGGGSEERVTYGQGCPDGDTIKISCTVGTLCSKGGGGGAGGSGTSGSINGTTIYGGNGGDGIQSDIDGTMRRYAGGAVGGGAWTWKYGCTPYPGINFGTTYGCGQNWCGGGGCRNRNGGNGIVVVRYPTDGSYGVLPTSTGGNKYTCGSYTIHCFNSPNSVCQFKPVYR